MNTLSADMLELLGIVRALNYAAEEDTSGHWITLHNKESGEGTTHVKVGEGGNIEAGPKSLEGQNVEHIKKHPLYDKRTGQVYAKKSTGQDLKGIGPRIKQLQAEASRKGQNLTFNQALAQAKAEKEAGKLPESQPAKKAKQPASIPEQKPEPPAAPRSGMKTGLFGQSFIDSSGVGEQKPLFHQPVEYKKPDTAEFKKFHEKDTPEMFPAKGEGAQPSEPAAEAAEQEQPADSDIQNFEPDSQIEQPDREPSPDTGAGDGPTEPPERPVAVATPDEPDRGDESPVQPGGAERGNPSAGAEGAEPGGGVEPPAEQPRSEQDIAQAVNRGEMGVDDVLATHPHLAGDALIEQHKRERDEEQARAQAEQEAEEAEHAMGSEADLPEGELPDFGDVEGEQPAVEEPAPAMEQPQAEPEAQAPAEPEPEAEQVTPRQPVRNNKAPSRGAIEKMLLDNLSAVGGGYTVEDEHALNEAAGAGNPFTFHKEIPAEVKDFIAGHPEAAGLRKLFRVTNNPAEAGGADAFGQLGDRYLNIAEAKAGTPIRQAIHEAKNSPDPQVRLLAAIYELPKGETKGKPQSVNPQKLETGSSFTIRGVPVEVVKDEDGHRSLKDGGEIPDVPIDALTEALPVDKGSLKPGRPTWAEQKPEEKPAEAPAAAPEPQKEAEPPEAAPAEQNAPAKPQTPAEAAPPSPEQLQADVQNGLAVLGINPRQAETLARAAIQMGYANAADAMTWALKNPTAKPQAAPSAGPSPRVPDPAAPSPKPAVPNATPMQAVRQRAKTTPPPSNLPPLQHQAPPPTVPRKASHSSALAASKPVHTGGPKQHVPATSRLPHVAHARPVQAAAAPPVSQFIQPSPHLKVGGLGHIRTPSGIHEQPGERGTRTPHHGKAMSEAEQRKAKGRTIQEMGHFSADEESQSLARMLALLEMVS